MFMCGWIMTFLFLLPFLYLTKCSENDTGPSIEIPQGKIQGTWKTTINGRHLQAFLGIPYAKPPIGGLRFRNPEPADKWNIVHDGTKEPSLCLQHEMFAPDIRIMGSEDCLYLNVYTPVKSDSEKYPVMVFIHGGAFQAGGCISDYYGPDMLLDKNVVLVTINHRIGILGFASTEDAEMPGNYGLKDQQLALKWVKNNIEFFGGNSESITIFGESSGAASVHYQMLSPTSKGLFHRAILMSGSADCTWALSPVGFIAEQTKRLGSFVNCSFSTSKELVKCLREVPAELFVHSLFKYIIWPGFDPIVVFKPVLEPEGSEEAFITRSAYLKPTSDIPMMAGVTSEDGSFKVAILYATKKFDELLSQLDSEWLKLAPYTMFYYPSATNIDEVSMKIRNYYFKEKNIDRSKVPELVKMFSDSWFHQCTLSAIKRHKGPTFAYKFAHKGDNSVTFLMTNSTFNHGVCHADDLLYLFPLKNWVSRHFDFSEKDRKVSETMVEMFTNFASYGQPTIDANPVAWNPNISPDNEYMIIQGENHRIRKHFLMESDELWNDLSWRNKIFEDVTTDTDTEQKRKFKNFLLRIYVFIHGIMESYTYSWNYTVISYV